MRVNTALAAACLFTIACGGAPPKRVRHAQALLDHGDYEGAERAAERELEKAPKDPALWRIRIQAPMERGDGARAVEHYMRWHRIRRHYDNHAMRALAVAALRQGLGDASPKVRAQAVGAATRLRVASLRDEVEGLIRDPDERVAAAAAVALISKSSKARERAAALLGSKDEGVRARVITGIGREVEARSDLLRALADPSPLVRRAAVAALGARKRGLESMKLVEIARKDADGTVRAEALAALAHKKCKCAMDAVGPALADDYLGARLASLTILARQGGVGRARLAGLASSDDLYIALRAAVLLGKAGGDPPTDNLERSLRSTKWGVRAAALNALAEIVSEQRALELVSDALVDERMEVRLIAARVLVRLGRPGRAMQTFQSALESPDERLRLKAAAQLLRIDDDQGSKALGDLTKSSNVATRRSAAGAFAQADNVTLTLVGILADEAAEVRIAAAAALLGLLE